MQQSRYKLTRILFKKFRSYKEITYKFSPELNRIEMVWKQMKYNWRDFKVMKADQIEHWVGNISKGFGNEYMFTFYLILMISKTKRKIYWILYS